VIRRTKVSAIALIAAGSVLGWLAASGRLASLAFAEDIPAAPPLGGSPVLPPPEAKFPGVIGRTYKGSTMGTIPVTKAPAGAPGDEKKLKELAEKAVFAIE
jgi:hypothetical protein